MCNTKTLVPGTFFLILSCYHCRQLFVILAVSLVFTSVLSVLFILSFFNALILVTIDLLLKQMRIKLLYLLIPFFSPLSLFFTPHICHEFSFLFVTEPHSVCDYIYFSATCFFFLKFMKHFLELVL